MMCASATCDVRSLARTCGLYMQVCWTHCSGGSAVRGVGGIAARAHLPCVVTVGASVLPTCARAVPVARFVHRCAARCVFLGCMLAWSQGCGRLCVYVCMCSPCMRDRGWRVCSQTHVHAHVAVGIVVCEGACLPQGARLFGQQGGVHVHGWHTPEARVGGLPTA